LAYGHNLPHNLPLLIEEEKGRNVPQNLGLQILGTAGQILKAYPQEIIEVVEVKQKLQELLQAGRIGRTIYIALYRFNCNNLRIDILDSKPEDYYHNVLLY
jgi:predicted nucleic acid-binding protein